MSLPDHSQPPPWLRSVDNPAPDPQPQNSARSGPVGLGPMAVPIQAIPDPPADQAGCRRVRHRAAPGGT